VDKKSSSEHKLEKRLKRACLVAEVYGKELREKGRFGERLAALRAVFPPFAQLVPREPEHASPQDANIVVFMRVCEQLVDSYGMKYDLRFRTDCTQAIERQFTGDFGEFLENPLTHRTFLKLMKSYARLAGMLYGHTFALGRARQSILSDPQLLKDAEAIVNEIKRAFESDSRPIRCGVVNEYAIAAHPDLPHSIKENAPLNVLTIAAYTSNEGAARLQEVGAILKSQLNAKTMEGIDAVDDGFGNLYIRRLLPSPLVHGEPDSEQVRTTMAATVVMRVRFAVDDNQENWVVPAHPFDLKAIVKQYRRSLPVYTEYTILNRKKELLQAMETFLTTY
jgi:hypothetical protein